eukprot:2256311-Pleurochrysis_carterae.AAC.1
MRARACVVVHRAAQSITTASNTLARGMREGAEGLGPSPPARRGHAPRGRGGRARRARCARASARHARRARGCACGAVCARRWESG